MYQIARVAAWVGETLGLPEPLPSSEEIVGRTEEIRGQAANFLAALIQGAFFVVFKLFITLIAAPFFVVESERKRGGDRARATAGHY